MMKLCLFPYVCVPISLYIHTFKCVWACVNTDTRVLELYIGSIWCSIKVLPGLLVMN